MTAARTALDLLAAQMTEDELLSSITLGTKRAPGICAELGLPWIHHRRSKMTNPGWPDLVIGGKIPAVFFWELKTERGKVTPDQRMWLGLLAAAGCTVGVRRPSDLLSGRIARELAALAGLRPAPAPAT